MNQKQIRVFLDGKTYEELKKDAAKFRLSLGQYAAIKINGYSIVESKKQA